MKKRKELDALVPNGKVKKKSGGSGSGAELLPRVDSDTTDTEEFSILQPRKFSSHKASCVSGVRAACVPLCTMTLFAACVVGSATLIWMQFGMRQEVDLLRDHVRQVEEDGKKMPFEFHDFHSQLNELQKNHSALKEEVDQLNKTLESITKELATLKKTTAEVQKTVANAPQLETLPKEFNSLSQSLAALGSRVADLETDFQKNKDLVKGQFANTDKDKQVLQDEFNEIQKKVEHLMVSQDKGGTDSSDLRHYIDNGIKTLDDILYETNSSIWDKLTWAAEDLEKHHFMIETNKAVAQNLTSRVTSLEAKSSFVNSTILTDVYEQTLAKVNESLMTAMIVGELQPLNLLNGSSVLLSTLVDYVKNLTKVYVALMTYVKAFPNSSMQDLNNSIEFNLTKLLQAEISQAVDLQNSKIKELSVAVQQLNASLQQSRNPDNPVSKIPTTNEKETTTTSSSNNSSPPSSSSSAQNSSSSSSDVKPNNEAPVVASNSSESQSPSAAAAAEPTVAYVNSNFTSSTVNGSTVNATASAPIHKPSQTGQSLNDPNLRPEKLPPD